MQFYFLDMYSRTITTIIYMLCVVYFGITFETCTLFFDSQGKGKEPRSKWFSLALATFTRSSKACVCVLLFYFDSFFSPLFITSSFFVKHDFLFFPKKWKNYKSN